MGIDAIVFILILIGIVALALSQSRRGRSLRGPDDARDEAWARAVADETPIGRMLLSVARPLADIPAVYEAGVSPQYARVQSLILAGGTFGGLVEIYLATQLAAILVAGTGIIAMLLLGVSGLLLIALLVVAVVISYYPWHHVTASAAKRAEEVSDALPDFAEMLSMPLAAGKAVIDSMRFVVEKGELTGPVADEVRWLYTVTDQSTMGTREAFSLAGERLGTPEARTLFSTLADSILQGTKVREALASQAAAMRTAAYQRQREQNKRLPVKLVLICGGQLLPMLLIVVLVPVIVALGQI